MTENFNYSHFSHPGRARAGYVGETYSDVEQRLAKDGEIQMLTPGKMMGYFKNENSTKETITEDGWVRTGDKGEIDEEGRLKITGRTKVRQSEHWDDGDDICTNYSTSFL